MNLIKLPEFLYCENKSELPGPGIVLQTKFPWIIGRVVYYDGYEEMVHTIAKSDLIAHCIVPDYNICIQFAGALNSHKITVNPAPLHQINQTIVDMAQFYLDEKVSEKKGFYKKYLQQFKP